MLTDQRNYGIVGWREFKRNRDDILAEYDGAKARGRSRPVKTSHGNAGEAAIRKWLLSFLPAKYGVTPGFIIPDIVKADYTLYAFDVIIYDKNNSPVLWVDGDADTADQGRKRAIPARYVRGIIEVKSTFNKNSAAEAVSKLKQINPIVAHLDSSFSSSIIFFDYNSRARFKVKELSILMPEMFIVGYRGGMILRCNLNEDMVGIFEMIESPELDLPMHEFDMDIPLAKDIDQLNYNRTADGKIQIADTGAGLETVSWHGEWRYVKSYGPQFWRPGEKIGLDLSWSYGNFAKYATKLLTRLEGREVEGRRLFYGQIFDQID